MQVKTWITSVGLGMVAGAAAILMIPRRSEAYRIADDTAQSIKHSAVKMMDSMRKD